MLGGANVRRIAIAAKNEFYLDGRMFKCVPGKLIENIHKKIETAVGHSESREVDVVLHVGSDDIAENKSVDFVMEEMIGAIETAHKTKKVREVFVCSVEDRTWAKMSMKSRAI